jgi:hypothetical protein
MYTAEFEKGRVERKAGFQSRQALAESQAQSRLPVGRFQKTIIPSSKSSVSISARYVHPSDDAVLAAVERLNGPRMLLQ